MNFWQSDFWSVGFWAPQFWRETPVDLVFGEPAGHTVYVMRETLAVSPSAE